MNIENSTETLAFELTNEIFSFELRSYDSSLPIYGIVLEFMFVNGGVF